MTRSIRTRSAAMAAATLVAAMSVAPAVAQDALEVPTVPETPVALEFLYSPFTQDPYADQVNNLHLLVRTTADEDALLGPLEDMLRSIDPNAPVYDVSTFATER